MSEMNLPSHPPKEETPVRKPNGGLNPDYVCDVWENLPGTPSLRRVADALADGGILSPDTQRAYSRQNIHLTMRMTERGRSLLAEKTGEE